MSGKIGEVRSYLLVEIIKVRLNIVTHGACGIKILVIPGCITGIDDIRNSTHHACEHSIEKLRCLIDGSVRVSELDKTYCVVSVTAGICAYALLDPAASYKSAHSVGTLLELGEYVIVHCRIVISDKLCSLIVCQAGDIVKSLLEGSVEEAIVFLRSKTFKACLDILVYFVCTSKSSCSSVLLEVKDLIVESVDIDKEKDVILCILYRLELKNVKDKEQITLRSDHGIEYG